MEESRLKELIYAEECDENLAYILKRSDIVSPTEYKVMESFDEDIFVKMMKILINGRQVFYYLTGEYRPVLSAAPKLSSAGLISLIGSIIENASKLKKNGFLTCKNVDASIEHIYMMKNTYKAAFIYLPVRETIYADEAEFEKKLRTALVKIAKGAKESNAEGIEELIKELEDTNVPLTEIQIKQKKVKSNTKAISIEGLDDANGTVLDITGDEFIIGKWTDMVDGVIAFNRMISRIHCKINIRDEKCSITDLKSANGTYVNGVRLMANKSFPIKNGDIIRLADSSFRVIEE